MKKDILKKVFGIFNSKVVLAVSAGMMLTSCVIYTGGGGYSETDGVYYDPNRDTLPEDYYATGGGNRVGEYYDYQDTLSVDNSYQGKVYRSGKYKDWESEDNATESDWGSYTGTEINYYNNSWGYPYGYYGLGYYPRYGWGAGFGWGWPYYSSYYDPYWSFGSSWGWPYYSSGFGFGFGWGWGSGYYGGGYYGGGYYGGGYYGGYPGYGYINRVPYKRSGSVGGFNRATNRQGVATSNRVSGFTNGNRVAPTNRMSTTSRTQQATSGQRRVFNGQNNGSNNNSSYQRTPSARSNSTFERSSSTNSSGSMRSSGGFSGGTSRSGGFSGGSSGSSGGGRSGGFRR